MTVMCVYATTGDRAEAEGLARAVVGDRLAACATLLDGVRSIYWWEGRVQEAGEVALLLKTTDDRLEALIARLRALHSYACPGIEAWPVTAGNPPFLAWVERETHAAPGSDPG